MSDSFQLKAIITAVDQVSGPMKKMQRQLKGFQKEFAGLSLGAAAAGTAMLGALALPITSAIGFESKMADVRKVVDGLDDKTAFGQMSDDILKLSTELPMAAEGIAEIVAAGGQSGIAREDLKQFATDAIKMAVAFDQTAADSGQMMAQWRTAFKLTQDEVVTLADKINYLGNTGPANAQKISDIVTRIGPLGEIAGVASGEIAALGATISGMGVAEDVAATGIKNFLKVLTAGSSATKSQKQILAALKINPKKLAADMQKDSKGAMLKVLESISKMPKARQSEIMNVLFGSESAGAIAPLLTQLGLLKDNFDKTADAQQYAGSMQKEYESRASTTENSLALLKNQLNVASITLGTIFLPSIVKATKKLQPLLDKLKKFIDENPDLIKSAAKLGGALVGIGLSVGVISKAFGVLNAVMNASPAKILITALAAGAYLIIQHWDEVGPVVMKVFDQIDSVVQSLGGWEDAIKALSAIAAVYIGVRMVANIRAATAAQGQWTAAAGATGRMLKGLGKISLLGGLVELGLEAQKFEKEHPWLINNFAADALNSGFGMNDLMDEWGKSFHDFVYDKTGIQLPRGDGYTSGNGYAPSIPLSMGSSLNKESAARRQQSELKVTFENAPPGMNVSGLQTRGSALMDIKTDVGYNPLLRHN
ncbi:phage tail tape measure protein [Enterobacter asburiae]|uniref:phage tail tape measure protein n=1 Tax=Enterobacter asburiae TaxID=61645 RepID=UPI00192CE3B4|nr:phage tail tape measure protein [Enterobacter asburiae]MBL5911225.1 phage tail tape measure protein [Enterobacter asburiae]